MQITSGSYEIMASGTVFSFESEPLHFKLHPELEMIFRFHNDDSTQGVKIDSNSISGTIGELVMTNFNSSEGHGYATPRKIGTIGTREVYMSFWVTRLAYDSTNKKVDYTFFLR